VKERTNRDDLPLAVGLYLAFCGVVALSNGIAGLAARTASETLEALSGLTLFIVGMAGLGVVLPLYLARRGRVELPLFPEKRHSTVALGLLAAFLFARSEYLVDLVRSPRPLVQSIAVFFGPLLIHFASVMMCFGLLLPAVRRRWGAKAAVLLTAAAWIVYHLAQFHFFPEGLTPALQFELFSFGLGYALFYLWSGSLLYTFALQHLVAVSTFIYDRDFGFGEVDEPFVMSVVIVLLALAYIFWAGRGSKVRSLHERSEK